MVCEIAELLIELHKVGIMEYIGERYDYPCDSTNTEKLVLQTKEMKKALKNWTELDTAREKYYPLNSFTNKQLCLLRQELHDPEKLKTEVVCLLKALLPCLADSLIARTVKETWQQLFHNSACTSTVAAPNAIICKMPSNAPLDPFEIIEDLPQNELQLEQLVDLMLSSSQREAYFNMTEKYDCLPLLTMLILLSAGDCIDPTEVLEQYESMVIEADLDEIIIVKQINEILQRKTPPYKLREIEDTLSVVETRDSTISPTESIVSESSIDLSLPRYYYTLKEVCDKLLLYSGNICLLNNLENCSKK